MKLKICRLADGVEIIGEIKSNRAGKLTITDPLKIVYGLQTIDGGVMTLTRFMPFSANTTMSIPSTGVIVNDLDKDIVPYYLDVLQYIRKNTDDKLRNAAKKAAGLTSNDSFLTNEDALTLLLKSVPKGTEH